MGSIHVNGQEPIKASKRNPMIDALKGYAIILVVLGHVIVQADPDYKYDTLFKIAYSFHMPLFMFLSGYLVRGHFNGDPIKWIWKKFKMLIIPYLIWCFIGLFIIINFKIFSAGEFLRFLENTFMYYNVAWFLPVLFLCLCALITYIYAEKSLGDYALILFLGSIAALYLVIPNSKVFGFSQVRWYFPFVLAGYFMSRHAGAINEKKGLLVPSGVASYPVLLSLWRWSDNPAFYAYLADAIGRLAFITKYNLGFMADTFVKGVTLIYSYALAFMGITVSYFIMTKIKGLKLYSIFSILGTFTLEIYVIHGILFEIYSITHCWLWFGEGYMKVASGTIIMLIISLTSIVLIGRSKRLYNLLFGGRMSLGRVPEVTGVLVILVLVLAWLAIIQKALLLG